MNAILVNLILAVFWLCLGLAILVHEHVNEPLKWRLPGNMSPGVLALLLALYNTIRVFTIWKFSPRRKPVADELDSVRPNPAPRLEQAPDPNFQFTDAPETKPETKPE
jgi:hypothetical protein